MACLDEKPIGAVKKELFDELLESVKQAAAIERGAMKPSRVFVVNKKNDVTNVRAKLGLSQNKLQRCSCQRHKERVDGLGGNLSSS